MMVSAQHKPREYSQHRAMDSSLHEAQQNQRPRDSSVHRKLFISDLLRVPRSLHAFVFGNPPFEFSRLQISGMVVATEDDVIWIDDWTGVIPVLVSSLHEQFFTNEIQLGDQVRVLGTLVETPKRYSVKVGHTKTTERSIQARCIQKILDPHDAVVYPLSVISMYKNVYFSAGINRNGKPDRTSSLSPPLNLKNWEDGNTAFNLAPTKDAFHGSIQQASHEHVHDSSDQCHAEEDEIPFDDEDDALLMELDF